MNFGYGWIYWDSVLFYLGWLVLLFLLFEDGMEWNGIGYLVIVFFARWVWRVEGVEGRVVDTLFLFACADVVSSCNWKTRAKKMGFPVFLLCETCGGISIVG